MRKPPRSREVAGAEVPPRKANTALRHARKRVRAKSTDEAAAPGTPALGPSVGRAGSGQAASARSAAAPPSPVTELSQEEGGGEHSRSSERGLQPAKLLKKATSEMRTMCRVRGPFPSLSSPSA